MDLFLPSHSSISQTSLYFTLSLACRALGSGTITTTGHSKLEDETGLSLQGRHRLLEQHDGKILNTTRNAEALLL